MVSLNTSSVAVMLSLAFGAPAHALPNRVWVSGHGVDAAGCGAPGGPCRSLQYAHDNSVAAGGEIDILDPAGFGPVTITKSLSIVNDGVGTAGVNQGTAGLNAITINAGATDAVTLRGLNVDGLGVAQNGIAIFSAGAVTIANCVVRHFADPSGGAILAREASGTLILAVSDVTASDNAGSGIYLDPQTTASVVGLISRTAANRNATGFAFQGAQTVGQVLVTMAASAAFENSSPGIYVEGSFYNVSVMLDAVVASANADGLLAVSKAIVEIRRSTFTQNSIGLMIGALSKVFSYGDNAINSNGVDVSGTLQPVALR